VTSPGVAVGAGVASSPYGSLRRRPPDPLARRRCLRDGRRRTRAARTDFGPVKPIESRTQVRPAHAIGVDGDGLTDRAEDRNRDVLIRLLLASQASPWSDAW
jgi:hypothetical protein